MISSIAVDTAFIAVSLESTVGVVAPSGIRGLRFLDDEDSINATASQLLQAKGCRAMVQAYEMEKRYD